MDYELRISTDDDFPAITALLGEAFASAGWSDEDVANDRGVFEPARSVVATADGTIVGHAAAFTRNLTIPGGIVPAAHVTMVSVSPLHRRRGLLNRMIARLHEQALELGEPLAVLLASEGTIYQRFGYGLAVRRMVIEADASQVRLRDRGPGPDNLRAISPTDLHEYRKVFDQLCAERPGWTDRDDKWWKFNLYDPKDRREGATAQRALVHDGPDGVDGYMLWRIKGDWGMAGPNGTVQIRELNATSPEAYRALWEFALSVDLTRNARLGLGAIDEPIQYLVNEPRKLNGQVNDLLWLRVLDIPAALSARRYLSPVDVVIEVDDPHIPANTGRFRLVGDAREATCTPTEQPADIVATTQALGAAYLGGASLAALAAGGAVRELTPGTLNPTSAAFGWHRAPSGIEFF